jgi:hypothetical protein
MLIEGIEDNVVYFIFIILSMLLLVIWLSLRPSSAQAVHPEQREAVRDTRARMTERGGMFAG